MATSFHFEPYVSEEATSFSTGHCLHRYKCLTSYLSVLLHEVLGRHAGEREYGRFQYPKHVPFIAQIFIKCPHCQSICSMNTAKCNRHVVFHHVFRGLLLNRAWNVGCEHLDVSPVDHILKFLDILWTSNILQHYDWSNSEKHTPLCNTSGEFKRWIMFLNSSMESDSPLEDILVYRTRSKRATRPELLQKMFDRDPGKAHCELKILCFQVCWKYASSCSVIAWFQICFFTDVTESKGELKRQRVEKCCSCAMGSFTSNYQNESPFQQGVALILVPVRIYFFLLTYLKAFSKEMVLFPHKPLRQWHMEEWFP